MTSLTRSALSGTAWNYTGAAVLVVTQIVSTALTARLIAPSEFGLYATAQAAAGIFGYLTLSAVGQGLLRRPQLGTRTIGTATSISLAAGAIVGLFMWLIAGPWSDAWHLPDSAPLVRVMAITLFLITSATVPLALLRRSLRFRAAAAVETSSQVIGTTAGVLLALNSHSALALVIGQTVAAGSLLVGAAALTRRELRLDFDRSEAKGLVSFAGQVSGLNIGFFTLYTAPSWVIARLFGGSALGLYSRANLIVGLPLNYLATGLIKVMYPLYGRISGQAVRAKALLSESITIATGFSWIFFGLIAGAAPVVVQALLGPKWHGAIILVRLCALIACANLPWVLLSNAAEAFLWMRVVWMVQLSFALVLAVAIAVVYLASLGLNEILVGAAAAQWTAYLLLARAFWGRGFLDARMLIRGHVIHGFLSICVYAAAALCSSFLRAEPLLIQILGEFVVALAACAALTWGRFWIPCSRVLGQRVAMATVDRSGILGRLGFRAL